MTRDYSQLSDFEINKRLAELLGWKVVNDNPTPNKGLLVVSSEDQCRAIDYCNSWADMGPLMVEHSISLNKIEDEWEAHNGEIDQGGLVVANIYLMHKNPLRAAAIVYLMMEETP
jgi:hypothetical protein